jgi:hypothetical protein
MQAMDTVPFSGQPQQFSYADVIVAPIRCFMDWILRILSKIVWNPKTDGQIERRNIQGQGNDIIMQKNVLRRSDFSLVMKGFHGIHARSADSGKQSGDQTDQKEYPQRDHQIRGGNMKVDAAIGFGKLRSQ